MLCPVCETAVSISSTCRHALCTRSAMRPALKLARSSKNLIIIFQSRSLALLRNRPLLHLTGQPMKCLGLIERKKCSLFVSRTVNENGSDKVRKSRVEPRIFESSSFVNLTRKRVPDESMHATDDNSPYDVEFFIQCSPK